MPVYCTAGGRGSTVIDLRAEHRCAVAALTEEDRGRLADFGIGPDDLGRFRMCGIARVAVRDGLYQPDEEGGVAIITPVRVERPVSPEARRPAIWARWGPIVDLLAWHPSEPLRWALRTGAAEWLGCIEPQYLDPEPVRVHRCVLDWLRAGCSGLVPLSVDRGELYRLLSGVHGGILAADDTHARDLRRALAHPWSHPSVEVANGAA